MRNHDEIEDASRIVLIDPDNLDKECIRLPSQYLQYAHQAVEKRRDLDEAKAELSVVESDLSRRIRDTPNKFGIEKATENSVAATILTQPSYKEALASYNKVKYEQELAQAVVSALEMKKRTLTLLVELHGMGYFSSPKVSARGREAVTEMTKKKVRNFRDDD